MFGLLWDVIVFAFATIPLYLAVKFLGGKTTFIKAMLVNLIGGLIVGAIRERVQFLGGFFAFMVLAFIYREMFKLKWFKAFIVWLVQGLFVFLGYVFFSFLGFIVFFI